MTRRAALVYLLLALGVGVVGGLVIGLGRVP